MEAIKRQIFVLRNTLKDPIDYTSGTDMVPIEYHVMDFNIPATAVAVVYVLRSDGKLDKTLADVMDNVISFCPTKGFFIEGSNAIRVRVVDNNKSLVSFTEIVRVGKSMRFDDDAEAQQKMLIEQLLTKIGKLQGDIISGITTEKEERKEEISVERRRIDNLVKTNVLQTEVKLYSGVLQKGEIILSEPITNFEYLNLDLKYNGIHEISSVRVEDIKDGEESFGIRRLNVWNDPDPETIHGANLLEAPMWMKDTTNKTIVVSYVKDEGLLPSQSDALLKSTRSQLEMMLSIYGVKKIKDTELTDLRVLWDGSKAPTARAAMQLQFSRIKDILKKYLGSYPEGETPPPEPEPEPEPEPQPPSSVNLFDLSKAEKGYCDATTGKLQNLEGYRTITLPYKTTDVIRKSKDVDWFSTWILLLDAEQQPILSQVNLISGNNFENPGWDEWKLPEETLKNEPKYQNAKYIKVACSTFGPTKDFNKFMVTINNPLPDHYVPPTTTKTRTKEFTYSENLAAFIRHIAGGGSVTPIPPATGTTLDGKTIVFVGDSITAGFVQEQGLPNYGQRNGYVEMLQKKYPKAVFKNLAVGGATVGHYKGEPTPCVAEQINNAIRQYPNADYIIVQGGVNDTWLSSKVHLGEISSGYAASLNEGTFCGALESIFKKAQTQWIGKKIGFLTTHKIPSAPSLGNYMDKAREICKKWSVSYLDLYNLSTLNYAIAEVKSNLSYKTADHPNGDGTHPNVKGYEVLTPKIESWLLEL